MPPFAALFASSNIEVFSNQRPLFSSIFVNQTLEKQVFLNTPRSFVRFVESIVFTLLFGSKSRLLQMPSTIAPLGFDWSSTVLVDRLFHQGLFVGRGRAVVFVDVGVHGLQDLNYKGSVSSNNILDES